jgi:hypothetical protein
MSTAKGGVTLPPARPDGLPDKSRKQIEPLLPKNGRRGELPDTPLLTLPVTRCGPQLSTLLRWCRGTPTCSPAPADEMRLRRRGRCVFV